MATFALALLALYSNFASADSTINGALGSVAPCAAGCFQQYITAAQCSETDFKCFCGNTGIIQRIQRCSDDVCKGAPFNDSEGYQGSMDLLQGLCQINGVDVDASTHSSHVSSGSVVPEAPVVHAEADTTLEVATAQTIAATGTDVVSIMTLQSTILEPFTSTIYQSDGGDGAAGTVTQTAGVSAEILSTSEVIIATGPITDESGEATYTSGSGGDATVYVSTPVTNAGSSETAVTSYSTVTDSAPASYGANTNSASEQSYATETMAISSGSGSYAASSMGTGTIYSYTPTTRATVYVSSSGGSAMSTSTETPMVSGSSSSGNGSYMGVEPFMGAAARAAFSWHTVRAAVGLAFLVMLGGVVAI